MLSFPRLISREMRPWLRLFEELEGSNPQHHNSFRSQLSSFTPSFDVKETKDSYVLDGELPGVTDKSALDLTFVDENTLVVKGRVERNTETGNPSSSSSGTTEAATENKEQGTTKSYHAPSVEEEGESSAAVTKTSETSTEIEKKQDTGDKYWVRERYVGEFQRAFNFPQSVDHEAVKASLKDGILSIVVPKKTKPEGFRKINIE
ncbi:hypothetical protein AOL_s00112g95 [Orbilia oligospora ATCC 24927]|uniref:SHSP domain-containing protein n=2 Tax=Orbilia oligospora TaxID=2813651 RepID=G1XLR5_ARTOA|nr:hypothetical protein AOL_s00112g95 [Orbilia oligospora ATCC 24927]EGX45906.1 hypothetical protein AOL_s00112g95 [Orbilia oligospora ATCC 24927]KAF3279883.1 hypothetical protein TWF970_003904 [Orbilia oligospora]